MTKCWADGTLNRRAVNDLGAQDNIFIKGRIGIVWACLQSEVVSGLLFDILIETLVKIAPTYPTHLRWNQQHSPRDVRRTAQRHQKKQYAGIGKNARN